MRIWDDDIPSAAWMPPTADRCASTPEEATTTTEGEAGRDSLTPNRVKASSCDSTKMPVSHRHSLVPQMSRSWMSPTPIGS